MRISEDSLEEVLEYVLHETDVSELAEIIYGEDPSVEQIVDFARVVVESLLLECLVENHEDWLMRTHCEIGGIKKAHGENGCESKRNSIEEKFTSGQKFIKIFGECFAESQELIYELGRKFRNYKLNKKNIVNDYSILFFTFFLYDMQCEGRKEEDRIKLASTYARAAYEELRKPEGNHKLYINEKKLVNFTKRLVGNKFKYLYIKTFITFTKALYFSEELHDIELYLYFERFQNTIIAFNIVLGALKEFFPEAYCIDDDENEENKGNRKLYELVYNEIRKLKDPEADEIKKAMKAAQHSIATFPKTTKAIYEESIKERLCDIVDVYDSLELLLKYKDSDYKDNVSAVIKKLIGVKFDGTEIPITVQSFLELIFIACKNLFDVAMMQDFQGNAFLNILLFSQMRSINKEDIVCLKEKIEKHIKNYINDHLGMSSINEDRVLYGSVVKYVDLEKFGLPILNIDLDNGLLLYLTKCI